MKHFFLQLKKLFMSILSILSLTYLILVLFGWLFSDSLIFFPQKDSYRWTDDLIKIQTTDANDVTRHHNLVARYLANPNAEYTLIYSHGNAVDMSGLTELQQRFYDNGYSIIIYDYSGYGLSEGRESEQQVYNDIQAIYQYLLENHGLTADKIISYGHSLGAAVATDLAHNKSVAALVVENPFVTAFRVRTVYPIVPFDKFSNIKKIRRIDTPLLVLHSTDDEIIPFWHGETLFEKAKQPKQKYWFNNAGHGGITHEKSFWLELETFVSNIGR